MEDTIEPRERIATLDAVRGFAVLGILLMNIVAMGLPANAYVNPFYYGTEGTADMAAWAFNFVFADGKMRALFTMLFGASMALVAERAAANGESPAETHYRRIFWLFVFGMVHAWFIWFGDILTQYAVAGAIGYLMWRLAPSALWIVVIAMAGLELERFWSNYAAAAAAAPGGPRNNAAAIAREIALYRGGFEDAFAARKPMTIFFQTKLLVKSLPEVLGFMALGIILYRNGFLTGKWTRAAYLRIIGVGYLVAAPLHLPLIWMITESQFSRGIPSAVEGLGFLLRPFVALAHAAVIILLFRAGTARWLMSRLEAAGRMAFSNYLGTSLLTTTFFYGYGLGWFAYLSRAELYLVVLGVWALILLWSKPWLERFRYGPLEWLWRTLARGGPQPMRRGAPEPA